MNTPGTCNGSENHDIRDTYGLDIHRIIYSITAKHYPDHVRRLQYGGRRVNHPTNPFRQPSRQVKSCHRYRSDVTNKYPHSILA